MPINNTVKFQPHPIHRVGFNDAKPKTSNIFYKKHQNLTNQLITLGTLVHFLGTHL